MGHVFAGFAVASRRRPYEPAALVAQAHGQAIELQLGGIGHGRIALAQLEQFANAGVEAARRGLGGLAVGVDRQHRLRMTHWREALEHPALHALGGRVGRAQLGVGVFDRLQFLEQAVVIGVRNLRRVLLVIELRVKTQRFAQFGGARCGVSVFVVGHAVEFMGASRRLAARCLPRVFSRLAR